MSLGNISLGQTRHAGCAIYFLCYRSVVVPSEAVWLSKRLPANKYLHEWIGVTSEAAIGSAVQAGAP